MIPLALRGLASILPRLLGRRGVKVYRGETLPHGVRGVSSFLKDDLGKVGRFSTIYPATANRYAMKGSSKGVPIIRSGRINPRASESITGTVNTKTWKPESTMSTYLLDPARGALPVDRMRSIGLNLKDIIRPSTARLDDFLAGGGRSSIDFQGIKNLIRKIKDPKQREILRKLFFGSTRGLKSGGIV